MPRVQIFAGVAGDARLYPSPTTATLLRIKIREQRILEARDVAAAMQQAMARHIRTLPAR
jgi:pimeloyl-ACP methyl ester carboxylesterase